MAIKLKNPNDDSEPEVYGNENFGIPKDCSKKQKFSTVKLIFYIFAVAAICVTGYKYYNDAVDRFLPEITYDKTNQPLIYHTASGLTVKTQNGDSYDVGSCAPDEDISSVIKAASKGKVVFFLAQNKETSGIFDLCLYNVNNDEVSVIDTAVEDFKINSDGKYVLYKKEGSLYFSDLNKAHLVSDDVSDYYLSPNNHVITFFSQSGTSMFTCGTAADERPTLVDHNITKVVSPKDDHLNIYYIKNSKLYSKEFGSVRKLIAQDVCDAIVLGDSVYYTAADTYERPLKDFFEDDTADSDTQLTVPDGSDFIIESGGLSFFDEVAFEEANALYDAKLLRDDIREYFDETPITSEGYSLYSYSQNGISQVDSHLSTPYLVYNSSKNIIVYKKQDLDSANKHILSDVESVDEALLIAEELLTEELDVDMFLVREGKEPFFAFETIPSMQLEISLDGKYLYSIEEDSFEDSLAGTLVRYEIGADSLKNKTVISEQVTDFALDGSDSSAVMVFNRSALSLYYNNKLTPLSENSCHEFFFVDATLFFYDEYNHDTKTGTLCTIRNGEVSVIDTQVCSFRVRKYNSVTYIKDYNPELGTGTLYIKDGNRIKRQDTHVGAIIN